MNSSLFDLSGHGFYVWASYGMCLLAILLELWLIKQKRQQASKHATQMKQEVPSAAVVSTTRTPSANTTVN